MAQVKEQIKTPEKAKRWRASQPIWCIFQNTGNQDAHRTDWAGLQNEEMKATQIEIKQNIQGDNSEGKKTGTQINYLEQK